MTSVSAANWTHRRYQPPIWPAEPNHALLAMFGHKAALVDQSMVVGAKLDQIP
jgi:hypothetical protein